MLEKFKQYIKNKIYSVVQIELEQLKIFNVQNQKEIEKLKIFEIKVKEKFEKLNIFEIEVKEKFEKLNIFEIEVKEKLERIEEFKIYMEKSDSDNYADENDFKAFYNLLLCRMPSENEIQLNSVYREKLFNNIILSPEFEQIRAFNLNKSLKKDNMWNKPTYSQTGEDSIIFYILSMLNISIENVNYLDLGANHAKDLSNTYFFYEKGAKGVLVEANPSLVEELNRERPNDIVLNRCVSSMEDEVMKFYILNGDGLSSPDYDSVCEFMKRNEELKIIKTIDIMSISVNEILEKYFSKPPTILNVDIEGNEIEILKSIDFNTHRPLIIIVEMIPYDNKLVVGIKNEDIAKLLVEKKYSEFAFTGINSIFIDNNQLKGQ